MARLTAVLAVCFAVGVAWPIAGGLQFVQRPPGSALPKPPEPEPDGTGDGEPSPAPNPLAPSGPSVPAMRAAPLALAPARVENRVVESCEGKAGARLARCDAPKLDAVLQQPLAELDACARARGASGVLSLGMLVDFERGKIASVKAGQSTTLPEQQTATLLECAEENVVGTELRGIQHAYARYWVYHVLRFGAADAKPATSNPAASNEVASVSGQATVGWQTAVVRESPASQAPVVARLGYGTRINVTGRAGDWYRIERAGKALGWVHHEALGL
jgi:SH3 domain-containing protein